MIPLSVLDLVQVREGEGVSEALAHTAGFARAAEAAGYKRFWIAEHHGSPGIAGGATSVAIAHVGHATSTIRVGAGGVMLPNHNPFVIAEQFGTLDALFPGRVDLGLGRAPGADSRIGQALHKDLMRVSEHFPQDVVELRALFAGDPRLPLQATPGQGANVEMWVLGSSLFGAQLAAQLGMPYAFASHFAPGQLDAALATYRANFQPSDQLAEPYVMVGMTVIAAETVEEALLLSSSLDQSFIAFRYGRPGKLQPPVAGFREGLADTDRRMFDRMREASAIGSPATVREDVLRFIDRTGADELIVAGSIWDPEARQRSLALTMEALR